MNLEWLPQALLDFNEIIDFVAAENPVAAVEQGDEIDRQVSMLLPSNKRHDVGGIRRFFRRIHHLGLGRIGGCASLRGR